MEESIIQAWFGLLDGNVGYPVYRINAAISDVGHYVLLRKESGVPIWNKGGFFRTFTLVVEIVTRFKVIINDKLVDDIDTVIKSLVFNSPGSTNLNVSGLIKVDSGSPVYLDEDDRTYKYYRKITRFIHQTSSAIA